MVARQGNGPGEVQDPQSTQIVDVSTLLIVDDQRQRIIRKTLDSSEIDEFTVPRTETARVNEAYSTTEPDIISVRWFDFGALSGRDIEPVSRFSSYNLVSEEIINTIEYPGKAYAILRIDSGQPRGAVSFPHTPELLFDYSQDKTELYTFWPEDSLIAVLDPILLDTVRTILVDLSSEPLSSTERDSLEKEYGQEYWKAMEELLPDQKVRADKMIVDHQNRIWLKLTLQSDKQEWIVLDQNGSPVMRAQFSREGMATHISNHHIGFRTDNHLFSLYKLGE